MYEGRLRVSADNQTVTFHLLRNDHGEDVRDGKLINAQDCRYFPRRSEYIRFLVEKGDERTYRLLRRSSIRTSMGAHGKRLPLLRKPPTSKGSE